MSTNYDCLRKRQTVTTAIFAICWTSAAIAAENDYATNYTPPGPFHQPTPPYPVEMGFSQHHSSTYAEGVQRGRAAVIQAWGNYALSRSQANILEEQSRWLRRINKVEKTQALYVQKAMWEQHRANEQKEKLEKTALGREKLAERRRTLYQEAYRLDADELNLTTGEIEWPAILEHDCFVTQRGQLEELFRRHVRYGEPRIETAKDIARCVRQMRFALRQGMSNLSRDEYLATQKFLLGLEYGAEELVQPS